MEPHNADINGSSLSPRCESVKSDSSMDVPLHFKGSDSGLSLESDNNKSIDQPINRFASIFDFGYTRCSLCRYTLQDPVTTPCGHNFCQGCIEDHWSQPGPAGEYVCPQCEESYLTRPKLSVNEGLNMLLQERCAGPSCDICSSEMRRAIKTCVTCGGVSYCEKHVMCHYTVPKLQKHTLASVN